MPGMEAQTRVSRVMTGIGRCSTSHARPSLGQDLLPRALLWAPGGPACQRMVLES